jgi:SAM-dependent methyltransferase
VTGIDGSEAMLERARARAAGSDGVELDRADDLEFVVGDLTDLPVPDAEADLVVTGLALTHVRDLAAVYAEFARVLRPGGDLVVVDVHEDLVFLGSSVKGVGPQGQPQLAATTRHSTADHLTAALSAGFSVLGYEEAPRPSRSPEPLPEPRREIGEWRLWPWTLLDTDPAATRVTWNIPSIMVWHLRRAG